MISSGEPCKVASVARIRERRRFRFQRARWTGGLMCQRTVAFIVVGTLEPRDAKLHWSQIRLFGKPGTDIFLPRRPWNEAARRTWTHLQPLATNSGASVGSGGEAIQYLCVRLLIM